MSDVNPATTRAATLKRLLIAAAVAALLLVTVVLPAEFGIDPTRIGGALGLTALGGKAASAADIGDVIGGNDEIKAATGGDPMTPLPLPNPAVSQLEDAPPKTETLRIRLDFDQRTEVKAVMQKAKAIVYSWKVVDGTAYVDFHGHDPARANDFWVRYEEAGTEEGITGRSGSLVAPFGGEHGWYWLNTSQHPITIELTVTGYFDRLVDYGLL